MWASIGQETLKATVARYNAEELLSKREKISQEIRTQLQEQASTFNLELVDVAITQLLFGTEFSKAIEAHVYKRESDEFRAWIGKKQLRIYPL